MHFNSENIEDFRKVERRFTVEKLEFSSRLCSSKK